jgi:hypothetical protein
MDIENNYTIKYKYFCIKKIIRLIELYTSVKNLDIDIQPIKSISGID